MSRTILVAGATGNTGRNTVARLSKLLANGALPGHRVLALTRSSQSPAAQQLSALPGVQVLEKNWPEITAAWLRDHQVVRAFIASHVGPRQFPDESSFHLAALHAGVQYVVRISTTAANVRPDCPAYYARQHWAIETMLDTPEFAALQWTSLQPNTFTTFVLQPAVELIKQYRETGKQDTLRLTASPDALVGVIDGDDVGAVAAHLLCQEDPAPHNRARYVLNGPEDLTGEQIVKLVEGYIGTRVEKVVYKDMSFVDQWAAADPGSASLTMSVKHAVEPGWEGKCSASTTSKEVLELCAPTRTPVDVLKKMLGE
ncbi:hypothetical protein C8A05DRAFT_38282 [Staphylotrichum tortipilum]|uniref:NmrA-like domain-containing protein n=1 Tax=Staphylotrichum tortipilum TaxID=2831512 RepID=A0AAN6MCX0_9PEZI|nr:hypothetical protein C8A05DRAFT_38282 [Staphylotrichum longicolle]